jgi:hypothetical protein
MEGGDDARFPTYVPCGDGVPQTQFFDFNACGGQIAQIIRRNRRDAKTALRPRLHQALGSEPRERFTYRALTRFELLTQLTDAQRLTGLETTVQEGVSKLIIGMLSQARRSTGRAPRRCGLRGFGSDDSSLQDLFSSLSRLRALVKVYIETKSIHEYFVAMGAARAAPFPRRI